MDLEKLVMESMEEISTEDLKSIVKQKLKNTVESLVEDQLKTYSDFGKKLRDKIKSSLDINLDGMDLPDLSGFLLNHVKDVYVDVLNDYSIQDLKKGFETILGALPETIKLSEIVNKIAIDFHENESSWWNEDYKTIGFSCEYNSEYKWHTVKIDPEEDFKRPKYEFMISDTGNVFILQIDRKMSKVDSMITRNDADLLLLKLYHAHSTKVIVDLNNIETEFNFNE